MNILITGASGLIGTRLTDILLQKGYKVAHIGRRKTRDARVKHFTWDPQKELIDKDALIWADAVINLAGASISEKRWTAERKEEIIKSRTSSLRVLGKTMKELQKFPSVVITASGVGWYGMRTEDKIFEENEPSANDFLGQCCKEWETAADLLEEMHVRVIKLRIGVVLSDKGGAYPILSSLVRKFIGSPLGSGKQWMPWIHIDDLCTVMIHGLERKEMSGIYNAASPDHCTNSRFMKAIGKAEHRPVILPPVPSFVMRMILGEKANMLLEGSRVSCAKLTASGFRFRFEHLQDALNDVAQQNQRTRLT